MGNSLKLKIAFIIIGLSVVNCERKSPGSGGEITEPVKQELLVTQTDKTIYNAGESGVATCLSKIGNDLFVPDFPVQFTVTPNIPSTNHNGNTLNFQPLIAGTYIIKCKSVDGLVADLVGATITVNDIEPNSWVYSVPQEDCLNGDDSIFLNPVVRDQNGEIVSAPEIITEVTPPTGFIGDLMSGIRFHQEGEYLIKGYVNGYPDLAPAEFRVLVDLTPPEIDFDQEKGMMLEMTPGEPLTISGRINDSTGTSHILVGEDSVSVAIESVGNNFTTQIDTQWGLNLIEFNVEDLCQNRTKLNFPFLVSSEYATADTSENINSTNPQTNILMAQSLMDDLDRNDADDLATLSEQSAQSFDFNQDIVPDDLIGSEDAGNCSPTALLGNITEYDVYRSASSRPITLGDINIPYILFNGKSVSLAVNTENLNFPLRFYALHQQCFGGIGSPQNSFIDVPARVTYDSFSVDAEVEFDISNRLAHSSIHNLNVNIDNLQVEIGCSDRYASECNRFTTGVSNFAQARIESSLQKIIEEKVNPLLEEYFNEFNYHMTMDSPAPFNVQLNASNTLNQLTLCGDDIGLGIPGSCIPDNITTGSLELGIQSQIYPSQKGVNIPSTALGSIKYPLISQAQLNATQQQVGMHLPLDLINQGLWAGWYGGGLELNDSQVKELFTDYIPEGIDAELTTSLPPVIKLENETLSVGLGGIQIIGRVNSAELLENATGGWVDIDVEISGFIESSLGFNNTGNNFVIDATPNANLVVHFNKLGDIRYKAEIADYLEETIRVNFPDWVGTIIQNIEVPSLDLANIELISSDEEWTAQNPDLELLPEAVLLKSNFGPI